MRGTLRLSVSALVLFCCGAAYAQTPSNNTTEEVVVTAERRTQNLMTTPIAATVLTGAELQNRDVFSVNDLQFIAPNLTINDLGQGIDFDIRGIGKGEHNTQTPIGVVLYRDGVSTFPGYLSAEPFFDIKSVEVYRGPQGTFVGQNATGGAVFVTTNDPIIGGGYNGYVQAQYGNYNEAQLQGAVNIPISDTLAIRVAGFGERRDSFYKIIDRNPADACPNFEYEGCKPGFQNADLEMAAAASAFCGSRQATSRYRSNTMRSIRISAPRSPFRTRSFCPSAPPCSPFTRSSARSTTTTTTISSMSGPTRRRAV